MTPGREHPCFHLCAENLSLRRIGGLHSRRPLLGHLLALIDAVLPFSVDLAGLMQVVALYEQRAAADAEGQPGGHEAGHEADASTSADGDPCGLLAAHIQHNRPCRRGRHPEDAEETQGRGAARKQAGRDCKYESRADGWFPVHHTRVAYRFSPTLGLRLPICRFSRIDQLRQSARRAEAVVSLYGLMAAIAGDFHTPLSLMQFYRPAAPRS